MSQSRVAGGWGFSQENKTGGPWCFVDTEGKLETHDSH